MLANETASLVRRLPTSATAAVAALLAVAVLLCTPAARAVAQNAAADDGPRDEKGFEIEVLDAQAFTPTAAGSISVNPAFPLPPGNWDRTGAVADGVSVLVIRLVPIHWHRAAVTFSISGPAAGLTADYLGSLSAAFPALPAPDAVGGGAPPSVTVAAGSPKLVFYRPPNNFLFGPGNAGAWPLVASITVSATAATGQSATTTIYLKRPTLFLNHGINSSPATWNQFERYLVFSGQAAGLGVTRVDWSTMNSTGYDKTTALLVASYTNEIGLQQTTYKTAATRVDILAHSAGGEMVKFWASDTGPIPAGNPPARPATWPPFSSPGYPYKTAETFGFGGVRRFISVGATFRGSRWADWIVRNFSYAKLSVVGPKAGLSGDESLIYDLGENSSFTAFLTPKRPTVSWFPIVGTAEPLGFEALFARPWSAIVRATILPATLAGKLKLTSANSDWVVLGPSQFDTAFRGVAPASVLEIKKITHDDETSDFRVWDATMKSIDLQIPPGTAGYVPGYTLFNSTL